MVGRRQALHGTQSFFAATRTKKMTVAARCLSSGKFRTKIDTFDSKSKQILLSIGMRQLAWLLNK